MNSGFKAFREAGYGYKHSGQFFFPFSFINQFHHWKSSLDSPKGWRVYFCCTYSPRANSVGSQLCMQTSPLASPSCANLTFIFYDISCQRMKNQKSCSLGDTYAQERSQTLYSSFLMSSLSSSFLLCEFPFSLFFFPNTLAH